MKFMVAKSAKMKSQRGAQRAPLVETWNYS